jgi:Glycosyltransferase family 87
MSLAIIGPGRRRSVARRGADFERALTQVLFGLVPAIVTGFILLGALRSHGVAYDFHWSYYPAARRLLDGGDVYAATRLGLAHGVAFTYPALAVMLLAPFALMGHSLADHVYMVGCLLMVPGTLWLAGVRDWRVYGIALLWLPVIVGWQGGNVSIPLALLSVLAWRWRDCPLRVALVVAVAISVKPFIWPLALWLIATRRWRAAGWTLACGLTLNLLVWAIVGFNRIDTYLELSRKLVSSQWRSGYGVLAVAYHLGVGRGVGELILLVVSAVVTVALVHAGLVRRSDRRSMVLAVALALVASPLVWSHYFVLLLLPLAVYRPRLSPLWAVPLAMCLCPTTTPSGWELALAWALVGGCLAGVLRRAPVGRRSADRRPQAEPSSSLATTG